MDKEEIKEELKKYEDEFNALEKRKKTLEAQGAELNKGLREVNAEQLRLQGVHRYLLEKQKELNKEK